MLAVSLVTYNGGKDLRACLRSLKQQTDRNFRLFVYDNNSSDNSVELVKNLFPEALIYKSIKNNGFGAGHNHNVGKAIEKWVLVLNQDAILVKHAIETLKKIVLQKCEYAAITPLVLRADKKTIDTAGISKTFYNKFYENKDKVSGDVWGVSGSCAIYNKNVFQKIGGFDERFFMYKEDVDLAFRINKAGYKGWYQAVPLIYHDRTAFLPTSILTTKEERTKKKSYIHYYSYRNHLYVLIKHLSLPEFIPTMVYELGKFCYILVFEPKVLSALQEVWKTFPELWKTRKQ